MTNNKPMTMFNTVSYKEFRDTLSKVQTSRDIGTTSLLKEMKIMSHNCPLISQNFHGNKYSKWKCVMWPVYVAVQKCQSGFGLISILWRDAFSIVKGPSQYILLQYLCKSSTSFLKTASYSFKESVSLLSKSILVTKMQHWSGLLSIYKMSRSGKCSNNFLCSRFCETSKPNCLLPSYGFFLSLALCLSGWTSLSAIDGHNGGAPLNTAEVLPATGL